MLQPTPNRGRVFSYSAPPHTTASHTRSHKLLSSAGVFKRCDATKRVLSRGPQCTVGCHSKRLWKTLATSSFEKSTVCTHFAELCPSTLKQAEDTNRHFISQKALYPAVWSVDTWQLSVVVFMYNRALSPLDRSTRSSGETRYKGLGSTPPTVGNIVDE